MFNRWCPGFGYTVTAVDGTCPGRLADFGGRTTLTVDKDGRSHCLVGDGAEHPGLVRFHQEDPGTDDLDVRVWFITDGGAGSFVAAPIAEFPLGAPAGFHAGGGRRVIGAAAGPLCLRRRSPSGR